MAVETMEETLDEVLSGLETELWMGLTCSGSLETKKKIKV
jgi:hypothetical protein